MRRTRLFELQPWIGGLDTSIDSSLISPQNLVTADNVVFSATGSRVKREGLAYLDPAVPVPDGKSSSGTTRTLQWFNSALVNISAPNQRLVVGERITVVSLVDANYNVTDTPILSVTAIPAVQTVQCSADVSNSLAGKYFLISAGDQGTTYAVWFKVSGTGSAPVIAGTTNVEVDISTNASANTVGGAVATALTALSSSFASAINSSGTVTVTNATGGLTTNASAGTSGFVIVMQTPGGHNITYQASGSYSQGSTAAVEITVSRTSSVICGADYWRFNSGTGANTQLRVYATNNFQLFTLDNSQRRVQVLPQGQVTSIVCVGGSSVPTSSYFLLNGPNNVTNYYVWFKVSGVGSDPGIAGRTGIECDILSSDANTAVASKLNTQLNTSLSGIFSSAVNSATITLSALAGGTAAAAVDNNTTFTITTPTFGATVPLTTVSAIRMLTFNNQLLISFTGLGNKAIYYNPDLSMKYQILANGSCPDFSVMWEWQSRVWTNDKTDQDKVNYCPPFDETTWLGVGDSGAMFCGAGDGDPVGVLNGYGYKNFMVVGKKANRYRITGDSPEDYFFELISQGLGNEGALAIPVDEMDVVFLSRRGVHSQIATDTYGDTAANYLSAKIKPTFNTWNPSNLQFAQGAFIPELNSIAMSIAETGQSAQNAVWLYNIGVQIPDEDQRGAWYRWPSISCQSLWRELSGGQYRLVFGTNTGRIIQAQQPGVYSDFGNAGIPYHITTGTIHVDGNPHTMKAYRRITVYYRPRGNFSFTVTATIDNQQSQGFNFNQVTGLDLLGSTFILGQSLLGSNATLAPFTLGMEGVGRGIILDISQPTATEQVEIWGIAIEYEPADLQQEVD